MKIKINESNRAAITAALVAANGRATEHTFNGATSIIGVATMAEAKLELLGLNKTQRVGARAVSRSGGPVAKSYRYKRITTHIKILRGSTGWFLTEITSNEGWMFSDGHAYVALTTTQDLLAVRIFRAGYGLQVLAKEVA